MRETLMLLFALLRPVRRADPGPPFASAREAHFGAVTSLPVKIAVTVPGSDAADEFAAADLEEAIRQIVSNGQSDSNAQACGSSRYVANQCGSQLIGWSVADKCRRRQSPAETNRPGLRCGMDSEGYVLVIEPHEANIVASSSAGIFYGAQTLKQLLPLPGAAREMPTGTVRDWPAMRYRGVQDDLSRGPVPTLAYQKHQIRVLAAFKANIYSPYFEHTLLYPNQPLAAPPGAAAHPRRSERNWWPTLSNITSPSCPNRRPSAISTTCSSTTFTRISPKRQRPCSCPGQPGTLPLIKDWFTQIAQEFPSPFVHIGADETWDLGRGAPGSR